MLPSTDSTNAEAARLAPHLSGPAWILALRQTAARGRRGRAWSTPEGNFAATYLSRPPGPPAEVALRSFVAALALHDAFVAVTGRAEAFALKWPNDVLLNGGKVAGILLESLGAAGQGGGVAHLAIGIGVNLAHAPGAAEVEPQALRPVSLRGEFGLEIAPEAFLDALAPAYARHEAQLRAEGFSPLRTAWLAHAARLGEVILARTGQETHEGTFETLDETGALVLRTGKGRQAIAAAEVFF